MNVNFLQRKFFCEKICKANKHTFLYGPILTRYSIESYNVGSKTWHSLSKAIQILLLNQLETGLMLSTIRTNLDLDARPNDCIL